MKTIALSLPRRTVRLRMALLYGGLFLLSGATLLVITYFLVRHAVSGQSVEGDAFIPATNKPPPGGSPGPSPGSTLLPLPRGDGSGSKIELLPPNAASALESERSKVLHQLWVQSGIALAIMAILSIVLGWIVAGRILRPVRMITSTARGISATNLHRRLALSGPDDELKELGDTFDDLLGRLDAAFVAQRRFVANASHELRTPLARQRTIGQVALSDPDADVASLRTAHERILAAGEQQERLIEALLALTRGHAGIEVRQPFDLAALTGEVVAARSAESSFRNVTMHQRNGGAVAVGHRPLAERLVVNLVDNALRYNVPGGRIEVGTETVDGRAVLTVSNTGPIVPAEEVDRLFQPFQRLDGTRRKADGLGLGLSIVEAIAVAHDATVTATVRPEGGLTLRVSFPGTAAHAGFEPERPPLRSRARR